MNLKIALTFVQMYFEYTITLNLLLSVVSLHWGQSTEG